MHADISFMNDSNDFEMKLLHVLNRFVHAHSRLSVFSPDNLQVKLISFNSSVQLVEVTIELS